MRNILIIDDDLAIRIVIKKILARILPASPATGEINVYTSEDGVEGLGYLFLTRPDLIIIDLTLPKYDGLEVIDYIKTNHSLLQKESPTIVIIHDSNSNYALPGHFKLISKNDRNFLEQLITNICSSLQIEPIQKLNLYQRLIVRIADNVINLANKSDISAGSTSKSLISKLGNKFKFLFYQLQASVALTFFYIFAGRGIKEENITQQNKDRQRLRVKAIPALAIILASFMFSTIQASSFGAVVFTFFSANPQPVQAATRTWDGGGATNNWSECANWSSNICPTAADDVLFNSTSVKNATIDAGFTGTVLSISIFPAYTGTITQNRSLTVTGSFSQSTGTFNGGSNTMSVGGMGLSGGTFTAPTNLTVTGTMSIVGTTVFNHNSGTITMTGTGAFSISCAVGVTFNLIVFSGSSGIASIGTNCNIPLGNNPTLPKGVQTNGVLSGTGILTYSQASNFFLFNAGGALSGFSGIIATGPVRTTGGTLDLSSFIVADFNYGSSQSLTVESGTLTMPSGSASVAGDFNVSGGTFNHNGGTITFDGVNGTITCGAAVLNITIFAHTGTKTVSNGCNLPDIGNNPTFTGGLSLAGTINGSGVLSMGNLTLNAGANLVGFTDIAGSGSLTVSGATLDLSSISTATRTSFSMSSGTFTAPANLTLTTNTLNSFSLSGGTFTSSSGNLLNPAGFSITAGTFNANSGTITFTQSTSAATISCNNAIFSLIVFSHTGNNKTANSNCNLPVGNNAVTGTGNIILNGATISGTGTFTSNGGLTIQNSGNLSGLTGLIVNGVFTLASPSSLDLSAYSPADFNDNFFTGVGSTLTAPTGVMSIAGSASIAGTFNANSGTVSIDGTQTASISCGNNTFNLVSFDHTAGDKGMNSDCNFPLGTDPVINGNVVNYGGDLSGTGTLTFNANFLIYYWTSSIAGFTDLLVNGTLYFQQSNQYLGYLTLGSITNAEVNGLVAIDNNAFVDWTDVNSFDINGNLEVDQSNVSYSQLTLPAGNLNVSGNMLLEDNAFVHHNDLGTVILDGSNQTITGPWRFNNFIKNTASADTLTFTSGDRYRIYGDMTLTGTSGNILSLVSDNPGTQWFISPAGNRTVGYLNVQDSYNLSPIEIETSGFNITDAGNNYGWDFSNNPNLVPYNGYTVSPFDEQFRTVNLYTGETTNSQTLTVTGYTVTGANGLAYNPLTCSLYGMLKLQGETGRFLATINPATAEATLVGNTGKNVAGIAIDDSGVIWAITGAGETNLPSSLYTLSAIDATPTFMTTRITGDNGETLAYNPTDGLLYHASGTTSQNFESINPGDLSVTNIPLTLNLNYNEPTVLSYMQEEGKFIISGFNWVYRITSTGEVDTFVEFDHDVKGVVSTNCQVPTAPNNPSNLGPASLVDGSSDSDDTPTFTFDITDPNLTNQVRYQVQIDDNSDFSSPEVDYTSGLSAQGSLNFTVGQNAGSGTYTTGTSGQTLPMGSYYWRIKAIDEDALESSYITANSGNVAFIISIPAAPNTPTSLGPASHVDGSVITDTTPDFSFTLTDPNPGDNLRYRIQIDNNSDFSSPEVDYTSAFAAQGGFNFTVGQAAGGGTYTLGNSGQILTAGSYFWRVRAGDPGDLLSGYATANGGSTAFILDTTTDLYIDVSSYTANVGEQITITVEARDAGNTIEPSYTGTVTFSSSSITASLPSDFTFTGLDAGQRIFVNQLIFNEVGNFTVTVTDTSYPAFSDTTSTITISAAPTPTPTPSVTITASPTSSPVPTVTPSPTPTALPDCSVNPNSSYCQQPVLINDLEVKDTTNPFSVEVCWSTNIPTIGSVVYGLKAEGLYNLSSEQETEYGLNHCITIDNLTNADDYIFKIDSSSQAGKSSQRESQFSGGNDCIVSSGNGYSFSSQGQAVINYSTISNATCLTSYTNSGKTYTSQESSGTNHNNVINLSLADGISDISYKISCSVSLEGQEQPTVCTRNGNIPVAEYKSFLGLAPTTVPTEGEGNLPGRNIFGNDGLIATTITQGASLVRELSDDVIPTTLAAGGGFVAMANAISYPKSVLYGFLWLRIRRKPRSWGIVYDEFTRTPVAFAVVRLFAIKQDGSEEYVTQDVASLSGKYGFKVKAGKYKLTVSQSDYAEYIQSIEVTTDEEPIAFDIPLSRNPNKSITTRIRNYLKPRIALLNKYLFLFGFALSVVSLLTAFSAINLLLFVVYLVNSVIIITSKVPSGAYAYDIDTNQRLSGVFVRVFDQVEGRQLDVQISNATGNFNFKLNPGNYLLTAYTKGYELAKNKLDSNLKHELSGGVTAIKVTVNGEELEDTAIPLQKTTNIQSGNLFN